MSYQVLARKWRPNCFAELVGQEHVVTAISNALDNDRLHHAYLFTGTRGVGKTTIARIFSKSLNCEQGQSSTPCGKCSTCVEIEQGNFIDLLEIDAASRTKVEDTRELLDNVQYRPSRGRYKVYLIDEVHMLSKHSFNALLKTLEEPPPHVKFLLATTDPQKLPVTILSRCLQFNLKALSRSQIAQQLNFVLTEEKLEFDTEALSQLARAAQGSMRDALSLTDQAIAQGNGIVNLSIVTDMLGLMDKNVVLKLLNSVLQKDSAQVMQIVEQMSVQSADFSQVLAELMSLLHQVALTQLVPEACKLETIAARAIYQIAKGVAAEQVQLLYQIALNGKKDLPFSADPRTGLEMTLLRMLAFCPDNISLEAQELNELSTERTNQQIDALPKVSPSEVSHVELAQTKVDSPSVVETAKSVENDKIVEQNNQASLSSEENHLTPPTETQDLNTALFDEQFSEQEEHVSSWSADENEQYLDDSAYEQSLFEQQESILQQSHALGHSNQNSPTEFSENSASPVADAPAEQTKNTTETMLALRKKLQQARAIEEENASVGKKSERSELPNLASLRQPAEPDAPADIKPSELTQKVMSPELEISPLEQQKTAESYVEPMPPWGDSVDDAQELSSDDNIPAAGPIESKFDEAASLFAMDPHSHLALNELGEVNIAIPVFLPDKQKVMFASQIDEWSNFVESMPIAALTKQLALHSSFKVEGDTVKLELLDSKQHLNSPSAQQQLKEALSQTMQKAIELEIRPGAPINTPFAIQQKINAARQEYAHQVVNSDTNIALMRELFAAKVNTDSIQAR